MYKRFYVTRLSSLGATRHSTSRDCLKTAIRQGFPKGKARLGLAAALLAEIALKRQFDKGSQRGKQGVSKAKTKNTNDKRQSVTKQAKPAEGESKGGALTERLFGDGTSPSFEKFLYRKQDTPLDFQKFFVKNIQKIKNGLRPSPPPLPRQSLPPEGKPMK